MWLKDLDWLKDLVWLKMVDLNGFRLGHRAERWAMEWKRKLGSVNIV